jgi:hypothetical protein
MPSVVKILAKRSDSDSLQQAKYLQKSCASEKGIFVNFNRIQTGLQFHRTSFNLHYMSNRALAVIQEFNSLPQVEQLAVYEAIARKVTPVDYGPLSDEDLTAIAAGTFALLDEEESRAQSR